MTSSGGTEPRRTDSLQGIGASPGVAIGHAFLLDRKRVKTPHYRLETSQVDHELMRFKTAVELSDHQLTEVKEKLEKREGKEHALIIEAHRLMLHDPMLTEEVRKLIRTDWINAEWATRRAVRRIKAQFGKIEDEYFRERRGDVDFVGDRLNPEPHGPGGRRPRARDRDPRGRHHHRARALPDGGLAAPRPGPVRRFCDRCRRPHLPHRDCGPGAQVPGVVGARPASERIANGDSVALDGSRGLVVIRPTDEQVLLFREAMRRREQADLELSRLRHLPCVSEDGHRTQLLSNIEFVEEVKPALDHGAEGIGLFRTEFLYLQREQTPSEEEHLEAYRTVLQAMGKRPVTIRTVDLGGDKISALDRLRRGEKEQNPALGLRALRFCLKHRDMFAVQLRALLRASVFGHLRIMFPMVSGLREPAGGQGDPGGDPGRAGAPGGGRGRRGSRGDHDRDPLCGDGGRLAGARVRLLLHRDQ